MLFFDYAVLLKEMENDRYSVERTISIKSVSLLNFG